ncbi:MAG: ROK family protein [Planctomycetota bacterium]|nr:ROK family protein [Planctomycetota bacterium]
MMTEAIGVDLGGTKISVARVDNEGRILARKKVDTHAEEGASAVIRRIVDLAASMKTPSVRAVGIGSPGQIDYEKGLLAGEAVNIPGARQLDICGPVRDALKVPCFADNDGNVAALAEAWVGAARGEKVVLILTLGTGIGGGVVIGGAVYRGATNFVAEFGHMSVEVGGRICPCGNRGCLERYASASAVARAACERLRVIPPPDSVLTSMCGGDPSAVTARMVCDAARDGDALAVEVLDEACLYLGVGIGNLINIFNPSCVVVGGGMSLAGDILFSRVRNVLQSGRAYPPILAAAKVVPAALGEDSGVIGAAKVALDATT